MKSRIYADHAATTPLLPKALEAMLPWLKERFGNPSSLHSFGREAHKAVEQARATIAECIGAKPEEIFFTSGGTEANNWAIKGITGRLIISTYEHHSVLNTARSELRRGREVGLIQPSGRGLVGVRQLQSALADADRKASGSDIGLVSVMAAQNEIGAINPIRELCNEAHGRGALFHTDAVQAVGKIHVDVNEWNVDFLSASAHKFGGPKGIGFLFAKDGKAPTQLLDGGAQERGARAGTENVASIVGMAAALSVSCDLMDEESATLRLMSATLAANLCEMFPDARILGPVKPKDRIPGFVSICIPGHPAEGMLHILDMKNIAVSAGAACNSKETQVSHVLKAIGLPDELARCTLRISLGRENSEKDVRRILNAFHLIRGPS